MNRRRKKKQQVDYVELVKQKFTAIDWKAPCSKIFWQSRCQPLVYFWQRLPKLHQRLLIVLIPLVLVLMILPQPQLNDDSEVQPLEIQRIAIELNAESLSEQRSLKESKSKSALWKTYTVKTGDTLAQVFRSIQLPMSDLNALVKVEGSDKPLSRIKQGQLIRFKLTKTGTLDMLQLENSGESVIFFRLSDGGFARSK